MKENEFQKKIIARLKKDGAMIRNIWGNRMQQSGWPDIYVAHGTWSGWIEFKVGRNKLGTLQKIILERLKQREVNAVVMRLSIDEDTILITNYFEDTFCNIEGVDTWMETMLEGPMAILECLVEDFSHG